MTRPTKVAAYRRSTHQRGSDHARSWVDQPNGESQLSQDTEVSPTARSRNSTPMPPPAMAAQVRALAESWQATAVRPVATRPMPAHEAPNARDPPTGSPPAMSASAASSPTTTRDDRAERDGSGQGGITADRRTAEQLGLSGLLLAARVPAYDDEQHQRDEDGVEDGHLGHRELALAAHVEDRPVERDHRRAGVDGRRGGDAVGDGRVQRLRGRRRRVADRHEHERPDAHQDPVAPSGVPDEARPTGPGRRSSRGSAAPARRSRGRRPGTAPPGSEARWSGRVRRPGSAPRARPGVLRGRRCS